MNMADKADTDNCKHCSADRVDKKIKTLKIDCINEMSNYWKHYLVVNTADSAVDSAVKAV